MRPNTIKDAKVLITVKAYPKPSGKYEELVCTAGLLSGIDWIRIYPVPFRLLDDRKKYPKYAWVQLDLERRAEKDFRPESYRPLQGIHEEIKVLDRIGTKNSWRERKAIILNNVYYSMEELISAAYSSEQISLATLKPETIVDSKIEKTAEDWPSRWKERLKQLDLFEVTPFGERQLIRKVPFDFSYIFVTTDGKRREMKIEDWEIGALYWNCYYRENGNPEKAAELVRQKLIELCRTDLHFFVGTTLQFHRKRVPNPFIIIGLFYPPVDKQIELF